jgi:RNA polymerase sigma-70 factor (ECF subfamily)
MAEPGAKIICDVPQNKLSSSLLHKQPGTIIPPGTIIYGNLLSTNRSYNEKELLQLIAEGDEMAFATLYRDYYPRLQPIIWKSAAVGVIADDILQSAFLKIWLHRAELPYLEDAKPWIFKVVYREYLMAVRKKIRYQHRLDNYASIAVVDTSPDSPFQDTVYHEIRNYIQEIIDSLPERRRAIYQMSRDQGLKLSEISVKMNISVHTVKSTLQTVTKVLRKKLKEAGYDPLAVLFFLHLFFRQ